MKLTQLFQAAAMIVFVGCSNINPDGVDVTELRPDERGFVAGLGIESQDLVAIAEKMARSLVGIPEIANAQGQPKIVLEPVLNETRFPINKSLFLDRIRVTLSKNAQGKLVFLSRERIDALEKERELKLSGKVTGGENIKANEFQGADFILTGKLSGISSRGTKGQSEYILYNFQLLDPRTSKIVWEDFAEIKKQGKDDAAYR